MRERGGGVARVSGLEIDIGFWIKVRGLGYDVSAVLRGVKG